MAGAFLGSRGFGEVLAGLRLTCLDVGARGGITKDLVPLASAVDAIGFEPDRPECDRLNAAAASTAWRSLRFLPVAVSGKAGPRTLYLTRRRGASSMLLADTAFAEAFGRGDYFIPDGTVEIETVPIEDALRGHSVGNPDYLKIDIEGMEFEVLRSAPNMLQSLLGLRSEVSMVHGRKCQAVFAEIDLLLRQAGFVLMGFLEMHHWRRLTRVKYPVSVRGPVPFSRGQLIHGDALYFRDPATLPDSTDSEIERVLRAAFLAMAYEYVDHAVALLRRPNVERYLRQRYRLDVMVEAGTVSRTLRRAHIRRQTRKALIGFKGFLARQLRPQKE